MNELALFAGAGGGILAGSLLEWRTVCAVEKDPYCIKILLQRQKDKVLPVFPVWDDVQTFDGKPWRGKIDIVTGGFPCQDISAAGGGEGISGKKSGLWRHFDRIIGEVRPQFVFMENSTRILFNGFGTVASDLAARGYDLKWLCLSGAECGAPHKRDRFWALARNMANTNSARQLQLQRGNKERGRRLAYSGEKKIKRRQHWPTEPGISRMVDRVADRLDRDRAVGNGQIPRVAALAFYLLNSSFPVSRAEYINKSVSS